MRIEHAAMYVDDLEKMKAFFCNYFGAKANDLYYNGKRGFRSYFLTFDGGARLELMHLESGLSPGNGGPAPGAGYHHLAFCAGSEEAVDDLTRQLEEDGYEIRSYPRRTGDGYYESVILDPENNVIEITQ